MTLARAIWSSRTLATTKTKQKPRIGDFGHKRHGDKRHRTTVVYAGITYTDGEKKEGKAYQRVEERYSAWSVKHDNRLVQNDETVTKKVVSYEETYNQIETLTSLDLMQRFSATAQGEIAGIRRVGYEHDRSAGAYRSRHR